jgi:hypothetical protein
MRTWQVIVKKYGDRDFVDPGQRRAPGAYPARKVRDLSEVAGNAVGSVPAFRQAMHERSGARPDRAGNEANQLR